ncbi:MAG: hypothetical protein ACJA1D_000187 [Polaribacter sp.]|jgi:hypothetical protein
MLVGVIVLVVKKNSWFAPLVAQIPMINKI